MAPLASHTNRSPNLRFRQRHSPRHSSHVYRDTLMRTAPFSNTRPLRSYTHSHSCRGPYFTLVQILLIHTDTKLTLPLTRTHHHFP